MRRNGKAQSCVGRELTPPATSGLAPSVEREIGAMRSIRVGEPTFEARGGQGRFASFAGGERGGAHELLHEGGAHASGALNDSVEVATRCD